MKLLQVTAFFALIFSVTAQGQAKVAPACQTMKYRKEWRDHTPVEKQRYINTVKALRSTKSLRGLRHRYDDYVALHAQFVSLIHGHPLFLPWHREFLRQFELDLQKITPGIMLPYWDWGFDGQKPLADTSVFGSGPLAFGTEGKDGTTDGLDTACILDGFAAKWTDADGQCLCRGYAPGITLYDNTVLGPIVRGNPRFDSFARQVEGVHNSVHAIIGGNGGDMGYTDRSPNDPIFYMHHANIDRLWFDWQKAHPALERTFAAGLPTNAMMPGLGHPISFSMISDGGREWCIQYIPYSGERSVHKRRDGRPVVKKVATNVGTGNSNNTVSRNPVPPIPMSWIVENAARMNATVESMEQRIRTTEIQLEQITQQFDKELDSYFAVYPNATYNVAYDYVISNWVWQSA